MKKFLVFMTFLALPTAYAQVADGLLTSLPLCTSTANSGTAESCTLRMVLNPATDHYPPIQPLVAGDTLLFKMGTVANTGAFTINVQGSGAKSVKKQQGTVDLAPNDILASSYVAMTYDGAQWEMESQVANVVGTAASLQLGPICAYNSNTSGVFNLWDFPGGGQTTYVPLAGGTMCGVKMPASGGQLFSSRSFFLPADWDSAGATTFTVMAAPDAASGTGNWGVTVQLACPSVGTALGSLSFNTAGATGAVAISATQYAVQTAPTSAVGVSGCAAGGWARLQLNLDTSVSSQTSTAIDIVDIAMNYVRK